MSRKDMTKSLLVNGLTELARTGLESFNELQEDKTYISTLPQGDGHPIFFIPGFLTGDIALKSMREKFEAIGYKTIPWDIGVNWGSSHAKITQLKERFEAVIAEHPNEKISIIGWSLGGVYARELARTYPENVRCVITMGSPFGAAQDKARINPVLRSIYEVMNPKSPLMNDEQLRAQAVTPPPVPTTSLFSKKDGVVFWEASLNPDLPLSENIDLTDCGLKGIKMSHSSFRINPTSITVIADRLAASADPKQWKRFDKSNYLPRCKNVKIDISLKANDNAATDKTKHKNKSGLFNPPRR
jgi:pimeloyl-ACP methyl ester carboxylesterase